MAAAGIYLCVSRRSIRSRHRNRDRSSISFRPARNTAFGQRVSHVSRHDSVQLDTRGGSSNDGRCRVRLRDMRPSEIAARPGGRSRRPRTACHDAGRRTLESLIRIYARVCVIDRLNHSRRLRRCGFAAVKPARSAGWVADSLERASHVNAAGRSRLLVLVESLGEPKHGSLLQSVIDDASVSSSAWSVAWRGNVRAIGPTTSAEVRELCDISASYLTLGSVAGSRCRPFAFRGGDGAFADAWFHGQIDALGSRWYRYVIEQRRLFMTELSGLRECHGAYDAICDSATVRTGFDEFARLAATARTFGYVLTIDSHLPVGANGNGLTVVNCGELEIDQPDACVHAQVVARTLIAVRDAIDRMAAPHSTIVVVGDHPPPFLSRSARARYLADSVPALILMSKERSR